MDEEKKKRLIIFTSQSFKQKGIRATRMDAIAHGLNISKRTIYEVYKTKDNLIGACLVSYSERTKNLFRIIECGSQCPLPRLLGTSKAFVENLYKGENAFWHDVTSHYGYIYDAIREIWYAELARRVGTQKSNISRLESGNYNPSLDFLVKVARSLGKNVSIRLL